MPYENYHVLWNKAHVIVPILLSVCKFWLTLLGSPKFLTGTPPGTMTSTQTSHKIIVSMSCTMGMWIFKMGKQIFAQWTCGFLNNS
jgi:hypothetical protein